jgi:hypothetical protein
LDNPFLDAAAINFSRASVGDDSPPTTLRRANATAVWLSGKSKDGRVQRKAKLLFIESDRSNQ